MAITPAQLKAIVPALDLNRAKVLADLINEIAPKYQINTPLRLCAFLAQTAHESTGFTDKTENLKYSAKRLLEVFPKYFKTAADAAACAGQGDKIANRVYASRMGNGNEASGDGFRYRGGGFIQITGKDMYQKYATKTAQPIATVSDQVRTDDRWAMDSAAWIFAVEKALLDEADRGDMDKMTRAINGGLNGQPERLALYARAKKALIPA